MKNFIQSIPPNESTYMRDKIKTDNLVRNFCTFLLISAIVIFATLILLKSCETKPIEPVMAAEVSLPELKKESAPELIPGCQVGPDCSNEELKKIDVESEIIKMAQEYHVDEEVALAIAQCESTLNIYAKNPKSTAKGVYQFTDPTWKWIKASGHQFDYKENIKQFMIWYQVYPGWWSECLAKIGL